MTVRDLIEKLQAFSPDARVFYADPEYGDFFLAGTTCSEAEEVAQDVNPSNDIFGKKAVVLK